MNGKSSPAGGAKKRNPAKKKNTYLTKSGTAIKLNRSLGERIKASREARAKRKAAYLATLPKNPWKRILYRMRPKELARYWFSRDGAIMALKIVGIGIAVGFVLIVGVFAYFRKDLPNIKDLSAQSLGGSMTYYDRTGNTVLFQDYVDIKRQPVSTENMSKHVRNATVAIEDKDFYKHGAFDMRGIVRAVVNNVFGGSTQGGSTISMQFAKIDQKNTADRTLANKAKELILAIEMEREYSKDDILTGYLNAVPYSPLSVGVQAAAQEYFGIDAKDLTIEQAAFLAAIPQSPSVYSPYGPRFDPGALVGRMFYIIDLMRDQGMITKEEAEAAKAVDILAAVKPQQPSLWTGIKAPGFVQAAISEVKERFGEEVYKLGGWKIITTVDLELQKLAEDAVAGAIPIVRNQTPSSATIAGRRITTDDKGLPLKDGATAAFVAMDNETGQIVAAVGNGGAKLDPNSVENDVEDRRRLAFGENNYVHGLRVSPGSTFKPYDYAAFIENNNAGAGSVFYDSYGPLPGYQCTGGNPASGTCLRDYDWTRQSPPGPITIRYSLGGSRNIPAVKAMLSAVPNDTSPNRIASINKTISTVEAMMGNEYGYACFDVGTQVANMPRDTQGSQCYGSSAIGDGAYLYLDDHVTGLATLARMGEHLPHTYILEIKDSGNKTVYQFEQPTPKQVLRPDTAYIVNDMAADPNASYLGRKFHDYKGWDFAIKTGTTNDSQDGLMASWSTKYTTVAWVGHHSRTIPMTGFMENMTTPIIRTWMEGAHTKLLDSGVQAKNWERPSGVQTLAAFVIKDKVSANSERVPSRDTDLYPSWYRQPDGDTNVTIDLVSNKTATECTPPLARSNPSSGGSNHNLFSVDVFVGVPGSGNQPSADSVDDIHNCNDTKPDLKLTATECDDVGDCTITITVFQGAHPLSGGSYTTSPASTVTVTINGQVVDTSAIPASNADVWSYSLIDGQDFTLTPGTKEIEISARVVDSVLYDYTATTKVKF